MFKKLNLLENITKFYKKNNIMIDYDDYKHGNQKSPYMISIM